MRSPHSTFDGRRDVAEPLAVSFADIINARARIAGTALCTPLRYCESLSVRMKTATALKIETMQPTGSFKVRGAANQIACLTPEQTKRGVITVSTGNHGRAVAYVARAKGLKCTVCVSGLVPPNKVAAIRELGARVEIFGDDQDAAVLHARDLANRNGFALIHPFDHPLIVAGQGTIAVEIIDAMPDVGTIFVPVSGGGLASGVALAAKTMRPGCRIVGVSSDRCPAMLRSLEAGKPVTTAERPSLADSLGGGIGLDNAVTFRLVREFVDEIRLVSDQQVADAMRFAFRTERLVLEGAGAAALAAVMANPTPFESPVAIILTGDSVDMDLFLSVATSTGKFRVAN